MAVKDKELQDIIALPVSPNARLVALEILRHRRPKKDKAGYTTHTRQLMERIRITENTLRKCIAELRPYGLIEKPSRGKDGKFKPGYRAATGTQKTCLGTAAQKTGALIDKIGTVAPKAEINRTADTLMRLWIGAGGQAEPAQVKTFLRRASTLAPLSEIENQARRYLGGVITSGRSPADLANWLRDERFSAALEELRVIEGGRSESVPPALPKEPGLSPKSRRSENC